MQVLPLVARMARPCALLLAGFLALVGFAQATAVEPPPVALQFDEYIHRTNGAPADPVNVIFIAPDADTVAAAVHRVLGWQVVQGSAMSFVDAGKSRPTAWQFGLPVNRGSRWHLRIEAVSRAGFGEYVLAAAHRDDDASCGHVGRAFNGARNRVTNGFADAGYSVTYLRLDNIQPGPQCDGSFTAGDGRAAVIDLTSEPAQPG